MGRYSWAVADDTSTGWRREHSITQTVDKVRRCGRFAKGSNQVLKSSQPCKPLTPPEDVPPRRGFAKDSKADPTASAPFSNILSGT